MKIPIEISARHIHLSSHDLDKLFGPNYELSIYKDISQPGQFASEETVKQNPHNIGETLHHLFL